ncbi:hypothetical protein Bca52824_039710 [Brassica carinata]|uniref:Uncharacterized protein n=1 Tax=Brassica carinata TaxID=52824 RepID=A0A8X7UX54_BRACI|nr:hypothetical protein Bca52824_039710 [Brassica carinata]
MPPPHPEQIPISERCMVDGSWTDDALFKREEAAAEGSEEVHTTVAGLTKEDIKTMFKDIVDAMREGFGACLKEIKYLSERVEAVEKKVGITTKRKRTSAQNTTLHLNRPFEPG